MNNGETLNLDNTEDKSNWTHIDPEEFFKDYRHHRDEIAKQEKNKALALGVEPFDVDEALKYYYPDELTNDKETIRENMASLEEDYYHSGAKTLKEWAEEREKYDVYKDSTGHD